MREIKIDNHPANMTSCYVHYRKPDGTDGFSEYFNSTKEATAHARGLVFRGEATSASVIKPQVTFRAA